MLRQVASGDGFGDLQCLSDRDRDRTGYQTGYQIGSGDSQEHGKSTGADEQIALFRVLLGSRL